MPKEINYAPPGVAKYASNVSLNTSTETDLVVITDGKHLPKSQLSVYMDYALGSATEIDIRYYCSPDYGTTWFQIPIKNTSTGVLANTPSVINSTSPSKVIEDIAFSATAGFKVTGKSVGSTGTMTNIYVISRDN